MKRISLLLLGVCLLASSWGTVKGNTTSTNDESTVIYNGASYSFIFDWKKDKNDKKARNPHWTGLGFAFADLDGLDDPLLKRSKSYSVSLNLTELAIPIHKHWLLASGVGIDWTRYHFKTSYGLQEVNGVTQFVPAPEGTTYKSSKLLTYYITIPLLLEYQCRTNWRQAFHINAGAEGLIKCYSKSQVNKESLGRDLNILPFNFRFRAQVGLGKVALFGYYQPYSMFKDNEGPDLKPLGMGLFLNF